MFKVTFSDVFFEELKDVKEYSPNTVSILDFVSERYSIEKEDVTVVYKQGDILLEVKPVLWKNLKPKTGEYLVFAKPKDSDTLRTALTIALVAAGTAFTGGAGVAIAGGLGFSATSGVALAAGAVVSAGVTMAATYLAQAIIPFETPSNAPSAKESSTLNITGSQNSIKAGAPIPYVIGTTKVTPPLAINPIREAQGNDVWLTQVFCFGYGPLAGLTEANLKLGDQPLTSFSDYTLEIQDRLDVPYAFRRYDKDSYEDALTNKITLVQGDIQDSAQNVKIKQTDGERIFTTAANTEEFNIELLFSGLVEFNDEGKRTNRSVDLELKYRKAGSSTWKAFDGAGLLNPVQVTFSYEEVTEQIAYSYGRDDGVPVYSYRQCVGYNYYIELPSPQAITIGDRLYVERNGANKVYEVFDIQNNGLRLKVGGYDVTTNARDYGQITYTKQYGSSFSNGYGVIYSTASSITATDNTAEATYRTYKASGLEKGVYEVSISRLTPDTDSSKIRDEFSVTNIRSIQKTDSNGDQIIPFPKEFCYVALKIKASDQLSGSIANLNCIVSSVVDVYDDAIENFTAGSGSGNPAWEYLKLLTGPANKRFLRPDTKVINNNPVEDWSTVLDLDAFLDWASVCDEQVLSRDGVTLEPRYRYNTVVDYETTVGEIAQKIATVGRAANSMLDGKYSIIYDSPNKPAVTRLTPANTYGFTASKSFARIPDAFRCKFVNKDKSYNVDEVIVKRDDNLALTNDSLVQDINCEGITDPDQVYRYAKYAIAQLVLRPEEYKVSTGIEHKYFRRGDVLSMTHDKIQGVVHYSRVKSISGLDVELDQGFQIDVGYKATFRYAGEEVQDLSVYNIDAVSGNIVTLDAVPVEIQAGDLVIIGTDSDKITKKYIVKNKIPKSDDSCEVVMVDYADPEIFSAEDGIIVDYDAGDSSIVTNQYSEPATPELVSIITDERALLLGQDGSLITRAGIIVKQPEEVSSVRTRPEPSFCEIQWRVVGSDSVYNKQSFDVTNGYMYVSGLQDGQAYDFRIRYITAFGIASPFLLLSNQFVVGKSSKPASVTGFSYIENREGILFSWEPNLELDVKEYEIREGLSWESATKIDRLKANQKLIDSRTAGSYHFMIKAIDVVGNYSELEASLTVVTTVPSDVIGFSYSQLKDGVLFEWAPNQDIDIDQYEIRKGSNWDTAIKVDRLKANAKKVEPMQAGSYTYLIKAIDLVGDYSANSTPIVVTIQNPSQVTGVSSETLDNNVQLRWAEPSSGFKIDYYKIYKESTEFLAGEQEIGSTYTTFTQNWESSAGLYTYYVEPIDIAGNVGARASITVELDVPPDFVLVADDTLQLETGTYLNGYAIQAADVTFDSDQFTFDTVEAFTFDQDKTTNIQFIVDANKTLNDFISGLGLVGQFDSTDDFTFDSDVGPTFDSGYSIQTLIDNGYDYWVQMATESTGYYEVVVDYGTVIPSSKVTVFDKWDVLVDGLNKSYTVSSSLDGISYTDYVGKSQFLQSFRYIKIRIDLTQKAGSINPVETLEDIRVKLDLKRRYDGGSDTITDAANGKLVLFNKNFLDVESINVTAKSSGTFRTAVYDFDNAGDQSSFTAYLFDSAGNKVTGDFSWSSEGY